MQYVEETYLPTNPESEKTKFGGKIPTDVSNCVRLRGNIGSEGHESYQHEKRYYLAG